MLFRMRLPEEVLRLFPGYSRDVLEAPRHRAFVIERLLEEGDSADLAWLARQLGEAPLADWLGRQGDRRLSRRSRSFWELVLSREAPDPREPDLWIR